MKILIIQLAKFGDIIQTLPVYQEILNSYPTAEIYFLYSELFDDLMPVIEIKNPLSVNLDLIAEFKNNTFFLKEGQESQRLISSLKEKNFDLVYNFNSIPLCKSISQSLNTICRGFGASDEISLSFQTFVLSFIKTRKLNTLNLVDIFKIFHRIHKNSNSEPFFSIQSNKNQNQKKVVFQLGSRNSRRQQSCENYAQMGKVFIENNWEVILTGTKPELEQAQEFIRLLNHSDKITNKVGETSFSELKSILQKADLLITGDTGTMHFAGLYGVKTLVVFNGTAYPYETLTYNSNAYALFPNFETCENYPCPENGECHITDKCSDLNLIKEAKYILNLNDQTDLYKTSYDNLGQMIIPVSKTTMDLDLFIALQWRKFTGIYYLNNKIDLSKIKTSYEIPEILFSNFQSLLDRELMLLDQLDIQELDFSLILINFRILAPLLMYFYMNQKDKHFIGASLDFFKTLSVKNSL